MSVKGSLNILHAMKNKLKEKDENISFSVVISNVAYFESEELGKIGVDFNTGDIVACTVAKDKYERAYNHTRNDDLRVRLEVLENIKILIKEGVVETIKLLGFENYDSLLVYLQHNIYMITDSLSSEDKKSLESILLGIITLSRLDINMEISKKNYSKVQESYNYLLLCMEEFNFILSRDKIEDTIKHMKLILEMLVEDNEFITLVELSNSLCLFLQRVKIEGYEDYDDIHYRGCEDC
ncbi:hypothetical protein COF68_05495 [Bacillus toyonensis]|uniref:hypothetical protein n=1 Tax=Bacillus toyonensis TaxID=155322 RepID=UPI000BFBC5C2|nr:hypothetical protein [Bacillus toyonensis]PHE64297.1 hypothetical protein COF68_05495 [Bacillus toyonensis]